jgi:hypothetical protein
VGGGKYLGLTKDQADNAYRLAIHEQGFHARDFRKHLVDVLARCRNG